MQKPKTIFLKLVMENNKIILAIKDDGVGFNTSLKSNGIGLMNIKTRAGLMNGKVEIISFPGMGCELVVNFEVG